MTDKINLSPHCILNLDFCHTFWLCPENSYDFWCIESSVTNNYIFSVMAN